MEHYHVEVLRFFIDCCYREFDFLSGSLYFFKRMKSIKEKADEKYPIITGELQTYNEKFVEGASYVLDKIENIINSDRILGHPFPSLEMRYDQIRSVIEN